MKKLIFLSIVASSLFAGFTKNNIYKFYKDQNYRQACTKGSWFISKNKDDDNYQSIVALSCVKADMINTSVRISKSMINSKLGRNNASYIASLFLIKKLFLQLIYDNINISNLSLPKSNHPLSILFEAISHKKYTKQNDSYIVYKNDLKYTLSPYEDKKIIIKIFDKNNILIAKHIYW